MYWPTFSSEEELYEYHPGGYHPVALGDVFKDGRYMIQHKLGVVPGAIVWLAHDRVLDRWVSLKIQSAERSMWSREVERLKDLQQRTQGRDRDYVVQLLDHFHFQGPNGRHHALVFEMIGPSIETNVEDMRADIELQDADELLHISSQMLRALDFIHNAGYIYGNLNLRSLVPLSKKFHNMSYKEMHEMLGSPELRLTKDEGVSYNGPGVPEYIVLSATWSGWPLEEGDLYEDYHPLRLFGFEEVSIKNLDGFYLQEPYYSDSPWTTIADCVDYRADLWAAGVLIHALVFLEKPMVQLRPGRPHDISEVSFDAPELPWEWEFEWERLQLDAPAQPGFAASGPLMSPHWGLKVREDVRHPDLDVFVQVIKGLIRVLPWERVSIAWALRYLEAGRQGVRVTSKL